METHQMRTWAEINLDNIEHNYQAIKARLHEGTRFLGVVKANGYGHGAISVARVLQDNGCEYMATATPDEAISLRKNGINMPILILGSTPAARTQELIEYGITQAVGDTSSAADYSEAAVALGKKLLVHIKIDSGMGRLGFICHHQHDPCEAVMDVLAMPGLDAEGIFTHFATSEITGDEYTQNQFAEFMRLLDEIEEKCGYKFRIRHCSNSGAMLNFPEMQLDMVRPGIALYGLYPDSGMEDIGLRPAMELKARIVSIKEFDSDYSVSYGRKYTTSEKQMIAVIPVGYADGLFRALSGKPEFLLRGKRVRQIGTICMDMCMIDISDVPEAQVGDVVTLFGCDNGACLSVEEMAHCAGTISYEIVCAVSERVPRVYIRGGVILH